LSATVSFLGKIYQTKKDDEILEVVKQSIEFSSLFVYPNGFYAGSMGSRNTLHFYSHGYEIFAKDIPIAGAIAENMLVALDEDKLVPPSIISDRYVFYRVPEYLQSYLDYSRKEELGSINLPYQEKKINKYYQKSKIYINKFNNYYIISNLAKGGVIKIFDVNLKKLIENNCGVIGELSNGDIITSQWVDPSYKIELNDTGWVVSGRLNVVPSNKLFTLPKNLIFRSVLLFFAWSSKFSHFLKGKIRKALILGQRNTNIYFKRRFYLSSKILISDEIKIEGKEKITKLSYGGEFFIRYVPQSRYFQSQELYINEENLTSKELSQLNDKKFYTKEKIISI